MVRKGRLVRSDGPYERHYPERRDHMVRLVEDRLRQPGWDPDWPFSTEDEYFPKD